MVQPALKIQLTELSTSFNRVLEVLQIVQANLEAREEKITGIQSLTDQNNQIESILSKTSEDDITEEDLETVSLLLEVDDTITEEDILSDLIKGRLSNLKKENLDRQVILKNEIQGSEQSYVLPLQTVENTPLLPLEISDNLKTLVGTGKLFLDHITQTLCYYQSKFKPTTEGKLGVLLKQFDFTSGSLKQEASNVLTKLVANAGDEVTLTLEELIQLIDKTFEPQESEEGGSPIIFVEDVRMMQNLVDAVICQYRCFETRKVTKTTGGRTFTPREIERENENQATESFIPICMNGLYRICIDTYQSLEPDSKAANRLLERVRKGFLEPTTQKTYKGLYDYRNLGEDFYDIQIVPAQEIALCIDLDVVEDVDENEVMAEVIFRLQNFLTPSLPFYTLQQRLEAGLSCDEIFNGPLLCNGFIDNEELEQLIIPDQIRLSDLHKIILEIPEVRSVNSLKIKNIEDDDFIEDWCFDYRRGPENGCPTKPIINLEESSLCIQQNGISLNISESDLVELIDFLRLGIRNLPGGSDNIPTLPNGKFRADLADYLSVQYEFPANYKVGENTVPDDATPLRKAQVKQLQAYLLFYDRLLANYLQQLSQVRDLLSVQQQDTSPTYFYQTLYNIPGIRELISDAVFSITDAGIDSLNLDWVDVDSPTNLRSKIGETYIGINEFSSAMEELIGMDWQLYKDQLKTTFEQPIQTNEAWQEYQAQEDNFYVQQLKAITEGEDTQFQRKHKLVNHLLARFGEQFSSYAASIFGTRQDHLRAKVDYLSAVPTLGLERGKAYNYRAKRDGHDAPDVWNTTNVAGLKKRVYRLLGWGEASTESIFRNPDYRLIEMEDRTRELPFQFLRFYVLDQDNMPQEALLVTEQSYAPRKIRPLKSKLAVLINNEEGYSIEPFEGQFKVVFSASIDIHGDGNLEEIRLSSVGMSEMEATILLDRIKRLIDVPIKSGFHLLEHILLRPNDADDQLLQMAFTCDLQFCPVDPYSFWISVLVPAWRGPFTDPEYRSYFMQVVRRAAPAHMALCFRWVQEEDLMESLEYALEKWREAYADCTPDECEITTTANALIKLLNELPCDCFCFNDSNHSPKC